VTSTHHHFTSDDIYFMFEITFAQSQQHGWQCGMAVVSFGA